MLKVAEMIPSMTRDALIKHKDGLSYMGVCVVQAKGAWTRIGPTWSTPIGWLCCGYGVKNWGTTKGLAELAIDTAATPVWHAEAASWSKEPNIVFAVLDHVVEHHKLTGLDNEAREFTMEVLECC